MATYEELRALFSNDALRNRLEVAVCVKAQAVIEAGVAGSALAWAAQTLDRTGQESTRMLRYLLAASKDLAPEAILNASDAVLQVAVDQAVDKLYGPPATPTRLPPPPSTPGR